MGAASPNPQETGKTPNILPYWSFDPSNPIQSKGGAAGIYLSYYTTFTNGAGGGYTYNGPRNAYAGAANTGNGATRQVGSGTSTGGLGGSGVAYVKYPASFPELRNITGSYEVFTFSDEDPTFPTSAPPIDWRVYKFTSSGTFKV